MRRSCRFNRVTRCPSAYLYSAQGGASPGTAKLCVFRSLVSSGEITRKLTQMASHNTMIEYVSTSRWV